MRPQPLLSVTIMVLPWVVTASLPDRRFEPWVEATAAEPNIRNINLVQEHFDTLKDRERTLLALALVRVRLNDKPAAAGLLDELDKMQPNPWISHGVEVTRAFIEGRKMNPPTGWSRTEVPIRIPKPDLKP